MPRDHHQRIERFEGDLVFPAELHQVGVEPALERVHPFLGRAGPAGEVGVLRDKRLHRVVQHGDGKVGDLGVALDGDGHVGGGEFQHLAGDALGVVADAFQFEIDADGGVGQAQRAGDRLLADDEFQAEPVHFLLQFVDALVAENDGIGEHAVFLRERLHAVAQRAFAEGGHFADLAANVVDVPLQTFF